MKRFAGLLAVAVALAPMTAFAKVAQVSPDGFVVRHFAQVSASIDETWAVLLKPALWWDSKHTWSGDAANLSLDARPGGCFCEVLPNATSPKAAPRGGVEHARVIYAERPRALRMIGALGPLQADAANATLTIQLKADEKGGSQVLLEYVVGGYTRTPFETLAPAVDAMLAEQLGHLAGKLGGAFSAAFPQAGPPSPATGPETGVQADEPAPPVATQPVELETAAPAASDEGVVPLSDAPPPGDGAMTGR